MRAGRCLRPGARCRGSLPGARKHVSELPRNEPFSHRLPAVGALVINSHSYVAADLTRARQDRLPPPWTGTGILHENPAGTQKFNGLRESPPTPNLSA